ncbi:ABC transporter ATP-binding protein [Virgisporangium aurantiacum]|uniref:ABC transporter ATP-binding protein n=1 Tax=Virgisporangium aurantiacum TaxID=175570 RepID=A0A8J4E3M7_9ACTN|nr:ATP-binding cassette domain-containing protein [Virgisporangium aurantiacum]GIJ60281.1 ABC transporter ATP-binding protein [Virgisporangium aurantiacum]
MSDGLELAGLRLVHNAGRADEVVALRRIDLTVRPAEFVTVVGSNGAGKSSLLQALSGAVRATAGTVRLGGRDITRWPAHRRASLIAYVVDDPRLGSAPDLSVEDNLALAMGRGRRRGLRPSRTAARRRTMRDRLARLGLGLENRLTDRVGLLSAGQRQSLTMVMAGLSAPRLLLLDEHLAALDPTTAARVLHLTTDLVSTVDCATIMVTHDMEHALRTGDRLLMMSDGRTVADLPRERKNGMSTQDLIDLMEHHGDRGVLPERA